MIFLEYFRMPFPCHYCQKIYAHKGSWKKHEKEKHPEHAEHINRFMVYLSQKEWFEENKDRIDQEYAKAEEMEDDAIWEKLNH